MTSPESKQNEPSDQTSSDSNSDPSPPSTSNSKGSDENSQPHQSSTDNNPDNSENTTDDGSSKSTTYLVIWGQLTTSEDCNVDVYCVVDPEERIYPILRVGLDKEGSRIGEAEEWNHLDFLEEIKSQYPSDQYYKYGDHFQNIRKILIEALASTNRLQTIDNNATSAQPEHVEEIFAELFGGVISEPSGGDWLQAIKATKSEFAQTDDKLRDEWESDNLEDLGVVELNGKIHDLATLPEITVLTSVVSGVPADEISVGQGIRVRLKGKAVEELPEHLQDNRRDKFSVPLDAEVIHTDEDPTLSPSIEGKPSNYHGVAAKFFDDVPGYGYIHDDEKIQVTDSQPMSDSDRSWFFVVRLIILLLILVSLVFWLLI